MSELRGHFKSISELVQNLRPINILMGQGGLYEVRKTELGTFSVKTSFVYDLDPVDEGYCPSLPKIPFAIIAQVIAFFKHYSQEGNITEALAEIFWDRQKKEYFVHVPQQMVGRTEVNSKINRALEDKHLLVIDCHSHNTMDARFSGEDDKNQKATGIYLVIGRLEKFFPQLQLRISCGGTYKEIPIETIFETPFMKYPADWEDNITQACDDLVVPILIGRGVADCGL